MLYCFDKNENLIYDIPSMEIESLIQQEELNKLVILEFSIYLEASYKMDGIEYVAHKDMENPNNIQMYRVLTETTDDYKINYQAIHIFFDELKSYGYIRDKRPEKVKASSALDIALDGSRWSVGQVDDSELLSTNFYDLTRLEAVSKIINLWNMDLSFYLTFKGNKVTGRYVNLQRQRGVDTGERFVYGSNALEVVKELDKSEIYTRIIPRGKGEEKLDENGKPTDGHGRRIQITDIEWSKANGDPIDKPKGQEYLELPEMTQKFGFSDGEPRQKVQGFHDIEDPKELIKAGYNFLVNVSRPLVQFKTKIEKRSRTEIGDIVRIIRYDLDIRYRTRIYKVKRNLLTNTLQVEFGDKLVTSQAEREKNLSTGLQAIQDRLIETETELRGSFIDRVSEGIQESMFNQDGYNYELKKGNKYGLPAGYYSFDREIDDNPQKVIYVGAGTLAIADSKKSNGDWNFRTFGTGKGFTADLIVAGIILGGKVRWNLEDGTFIIGNSPSDYSLYWDGSTLHLRNVDIDLKNNRTIQDLKNKQGLTEKEIADHKRELEEANAELNKAKNDLNLAKNEITSLSNDFTLSGLEQDKTNKTVKEKLLNLSTSLNITDEKIESTAESIRKELEIYTNNKDKDVRAFLSKYYSSKTQTDQKIEDKVGALRTSFNDKVSGLKNTISKTQSSISQINDNVNISVKEFKKSITGSLSDMSSKINSFSNKHVNFIKSSDNWDIDNVSGSRAYLGSGTGNLNLYPNTSGTDFVYYLKLENVEDVDEYTLYLDLSAMTGMINFFSFTLTNKMGRPITDDIYVGAGYASGKKLRRKLTRRKNNKDTPFHLKILMNIRENNQFKDEWARINNKSIALVSGWHEDLTWDDTYLLKNLEIDDLKAEIDVNSRGIALRVRENEVISAINQSAEQIKIQANKINLQGNVHVTGVFDTITEDYQGINIRKNQIQFIDNTINDKKKTFGQFKTDKLPSGNQGGVLRLDHYATGMMAINWIDKWEYDNKHHYVVFDNFGYTSYSNPKWPIHFFESVTMQKHKSLRFGDWEIVSERDSTLKIKPVDKKAGYLFAYNDWQHEDGLYHYWAADGKDRTHEIKKMIKF